MILTAQQPAYLPWCGLFAKIAMADTFVSLDSVQFEKNSYINRNKIWTSQGPSWLTVPVHHHLDTKINEIEIENELPWMRKHWRSIEQSYHKAPYFSVFLENTLYARPWSKLVDLNEWVLHYLLGALDINVKFL